MIIPSPSFQQFKRNATKLDVDGKEFFCSWAFDIGPHYWEIFGVKYGTWIDQEKAKPLRAEKVIDLLAKNPDMLAKEAKSIATKVIKPTKNGWALYQAEAFDFSEGYLFNHRAENYSVQILGYESDDFILLFFDQIKKRYFKLANVDLKDFFYFLETGNQKTLIDRNPMMLPESDLKYEIKQHLESKDSLQGRLF